MACLLYQIFAFLLRHRLQGASFRLFWSENDPKSVSKKFRDEVKVLIGKAKTAVSSDSSN